MQRHIFKYLAYCCCSAFQLLVQRYVLFRTAIYTNQRSPSPTGRAKSQRSHPDGQSLQKQNPIIERIHIFCRSRALCDTPNGERPESWRGIERSVTKESTCQVCRIRLNCFGQYPGRDGIVLVRFTHFHQFSRNAGDSGDLLQIMVTQCILSILSRPVNQLEQTDIASGLCVCVH